MPVQSTYTVLNATGATLSACSTAMNSAIAAGQAASTAQPMNIVGDIQMNSLLDVTLQINMSLLVIIFT